MMAQVNITINQDEILQLLRKDDCSGSFREFLQGVLNQFLMIESAEQLKAGPYERTEDRTDSRNGQRERPLTTRIGTITLSVPRHRNQPFHTMLFENYQRSEAALVATMAEMVVRGVSTRKVGRIMETLCGKGFSKSTVSEACKRLDAEVQAFLGRPIEPGRYPFLMLDATYFKVRDSHRITSRAFMTAIGITGEGERELLGFGLYNDESNNTWTEFVQGLKARGLSGIMMFTSDAHPSIRHAMNKEFPDAAWQRCQFHLTKNILDATPKSYRAGLESELHEMFNCATAGEARKRRDEIINDYSDVAENAMEILDNGFEDSMTVMALPREMQRPLRTSNIMERLNRELKRRSDVIGTFPNNDSVTRLMGSVAIDYNETLSIKRKLFYSTSMSKIAEETRLELIKLAHTQAKAA